MLGSSLIPLQVPLKCHLLFHPATDTWILLGIQESCKIPQKLHLTAQVCGTSFHVVVVSMPKIPAHFCREHTYPTQGGRSRCFSTFLDSPFPTIAVNNYQRASHTQFAGAVLLCAISNEHPFHYLFKDASVCHW